MSAKVEQQLSEPPRQLLESTNDNAKSLFNQFRTLSVKDKSSIIPEEELLKIWKRLTQNEDNNLVYAANTVLVLATQHRFQFDMFGDLESNDEQARFEEFKATEWKKQYSREFIDLLCDACFNSEDRRPSREVILDYCENASVTGYCSGKVLIPTGLPKEEKEVYTKLLEVVDQREATSRRPPQIVVISDIAKDVDDLVAWMVLKELHRLGLIVLRGFITNLEPARQRALHGRGALDHLYLPAIPVAQGTIGGDKVHKDKPWEFDFAKDFMAPKDTRLANGAELLTNICAEARRENQKLTFLCISSLRDIHEFTETNPSTLPEVAERVVFQGGYDITDSGGIVPKPNKLAPETMDAANNKMDPESAAAFHRYISLHKIPTICYTKTAVFATEIPIQLCIDLEATGHVLGKYLRKAQIKMDVDFYYNTVYPEKDMPIFLTQEGFLRDKSSWWKENAHLFPRPNFPDAGKEKGEIIKYLTKLLAYDALAALGASGDDVLSHLDILQPDRANPLHRVIGIAGDKDAGILPDPVMNPPSMVKAIMALTRGSILAAQQHSGRAYGLDGGYMGYRRKNRI